MSKIAGMEGIGKVPDEKIRQMKDLFRPVTLSVRSFNLNPNKIIKLTKDVS